MVAFFFLLQSKRETMGVWMELMIIFFLRLLQNSVGMFVTNKKRARHFLFLQACPRRHHGYRTIVLLAVIWMMDQCH
jgi:hypothetical protein